MHTVQAPDLFSQNLSQTLFLYLETLFKNQAESKDGIGFVTQIC
jgi:hypothetical protein